MRREETPFHSSCKYFHFVLSFRVEIHNQRLLPPLTANDPTSATNPEHKSAVANNTTSVHRVVSGRSSSVLSSTPEKPNLITRTTSATPPHPGKPICGILSPGSRQSAATTTAEATVTNKTLELRLAPCGDSIPVCWVPIFIEPPIRAPAGNSHRDAP